MRIEVRLPANRNLPGVLYVAKPMDTIKRFEDIPLLESVLDKGWLKVFSCPCLAKADNLAAAKAGNPNRDPLCKFGDTPLGQWRGRISAKPMADTRTYGIHRVIMLEPVGGDALAAYKLGRRGIWLHGGSLRVGRLRPTHGCIRVSDDSMKAILEIFSAPLEWIPVDTMAA